MIGACCQTWNGVKLRNYPAAFGLAIANILENLKAEARGCPQPPATVPCALESFLSAVDAPEHGDLYKTANLGAVYEYLRGGKHLSIPPE